VLGVISVIAAIAAFATPYNAFWALASILGFLLVLKGSLDIIASAMTKDVNELWGLGLLTGILELILGFWASQQFFPARAALILIWVGLMALFRAFRRSFWRSRFAGCTRPPRNVARDLGASASEFHARRPSRELRLYPEG
jgi:uncharacterized membrane protein HdeD (DUF308 family)